MITPDFPSATEFVEQYDLRKNQILGCPISADLDTPVSAYLKLCHDRDNSFLFESVEGGQTLGRYSVIGTDPDLTWSYNNQKITCSDTRFEAYDPLSSLRAILEECHIPDLDSSLPPMAASGLFGYMGYDMIRLYEDIPDSNPDILKIPEGIFIRPQILVIFDNIKHQMIVVAPVYYNANIAAETAWDMASERLANTIARLNDPLPSTSLHHQTALSLPLVTESNMEESAFHAMVERAIEDIYAGDIFQVVLSQRFSTPFDLPPFELYRSLRQLNPSPFLFFLRLNGFSLIGSSPEILVRLRDGTVTIRPIAGTRKRGTTDSEDQAMAEELLGDEKERAEHLMLLDLGRNDVGRVVNTGSVRVTESFIIEKYSHVMHIVSNVEGRLKEGLDALDALFSGFPAGTVSGAPKIRAMEIIDELEPVRRSFYGGGIGYLSGNGDMDICIALRTGIVKDGVLSVQAGGGVVADSTPGFEYQESVNKAKALFSAAENAIHRARIKQSPA